MKQVQRVLVAGGAGFIGSHLCQALIDQRYRVTVIDLVPPSRRIPEVHYIQGDAADPQLISETIKDCDAVVHLAAVASVALCQEKPFLSQRCNLDSTLTLLDALKKENASRPTPIRIIFSSTSAIYGNPQLRNAENQIIPLSESQNTPDPQSIYAIQKLASEFLIKSYKVYNVPSVIFRFFNVYGPYQDPHSPYSGVISIFFDKIGKKQPIQLHNGGIQTRDFVSVHDIVRALSLAVTQPIENCQGQIYNLGTGKSTSVRELSQIVMKALGDPVATTDAPARVGDVLDSLAGIEKAKEELGWQPRVPLSDGLQELKQYF